jgi:nucleotide-binding universal stress UspA family protein
MFANEIGNGLVIGVDDSAASDAALRWAAREAGLRALPLTLLHVVAPRLADSTMGPTGGGPTQWQEDRAGQVVDRAREIVDDVAGQTLPQVHIRVHYGSVVPALIKASKDARLVVVGGRPDGSPPHRLGSVGSELVHHAQCAVAVVHDPGTAGHQPIEDAPVLVGVDGSPGSDAATAWAFEEASRRRVPLVALHAWSDVGVFPILGMDWRQRRDEGSEMLTERLGRWQEKFPAVHVCPRLVEDVPASWLVDESKHAQLVVVGRHGRGASAGMLLGSVSSEVVRSARVPVVVVHASE